MTYRDTPCVRCLGHAAATCARCNDHLCAGHATSAHAWCALCDEEWQEDQDFANAEATLRGPAMLDGGGVGQNGAAAGNLLLLLMAAIARPFQRRTALRQAADAFMKRSRGEIDAWRARHRSAVE